MKINVRQYALTLIMLFLPVFSQADVHQHQPSTDAMSAEVLTYVNQYRASRGLPALLMNDAANREAHKHSLEMANHHVPFGHNGFSQRMKHVYQQVENADGGAENVAYNYKTARIVVDGWIRSSGHRQNMVGRYDMTGIGIVRDSQGRLYFTQLFVRTNKHAHPKTRTARSQRRVHFFLG